MSDDRQPPALRILRGNPDPAELAAVLAVVTDAAAAEDAARTEPAIGPRSRWELSARALRSPLARDAGWGGFHD